MTRTAAGRRLSLALVAVVATVPLLTGCVVVREEWNALQRERSGTQAPGVVKPAILAADPRVDEVLTLQVGPSGFARIMTVVISVSGDEPVETSTALAVLTAAASTAQSEIHYLELGARPASDTSQLLNLEDAAAGLPPDVDWRWQDSKIVVTNPDVLDER